MDKFTAVEVSFNNGYQSGVEALVAAIERSEYCHNTSKEWSMLIVINNLQLEKIAKELVDSRAGLHV